MFESLSNRLTNVFQSLTGRGVLTEENMTDALREIRVALLEADVALPVAKEFINQVKEKALGEKVIQSIKPGQQVVKIVHDHLVEVLGKELVPLNVEVAPPAIILMVGLQGSGKTTTSGKLARFLKDKQKKKVLMASLDVYRPAAQHQLKVLGEQVGVDTLEIIEGQKPEKITDRALKEAKLGAYDVLILDTAGRLSIDAEMMAEVKTVEALAHPHETLLVVDAMTGQDAVHTAQNFKDALTLTGVVLTRIDGDARGGAALSMRSVTGVPIKLMGVGEKLEALEPFHPDRIASRILDMGDIVSLVERAAEVVDEKEAEKMASKMFSGKFDLDDLAKQLKQVKKLGGLGGIMKLIPGIGRMQDQIKKAGVNENMLARQEAILSSMTALERQNPDLIKASRKQRIAAGSGTSVQDVNKLLKQFQQMSSMMKSMGKMAKSGKLPKLPVDISEKMGKFQPPQ